MPLQNRNRAEEGGRASHGGTKLTKPLEAKWLKQLVIMIIASISKRRSHGGYRACHQWLTAILGPIFEKLIVIDGFYIADLGGEGNRARAPKLDLRPVLSMA